MSSDGLCAWSLAAGLVLLPHAEDRGILEPLLVSAAPAGLQSARTPVAVVDATGGVHVFWLTCKDGHWRVAHRGLESETIELLSPPEEQALSFSVASSAQGTLVVAWEGLQSGKARAALRATTDGGASWQPTRALDAPTWQVMGPVLRFDASGTLHAAWASSEEASWSVHHRRSRDGGVSWPEETREVGQDYWPDRNLSALELLCAGDTLLLAYVATSRELVVRVSQDSGATFGPAQRPAPRGALEPRVFAPGERSFALAWSDAEGTLHLRRSPDGEHWMEASVLLASEPGASQRLLDLVLAGGVGGLAALVSTARAGQAGSLAILQTDGEGTPWSAPHPLEALPAGQSVEGVLKATDEGWAALWTGGTDRFPAVRFAQRAGESWTAPRALQGAHAGRASARAPVLLADGPDWLALWEDRAHGDGAPGVWLRRIRAGSAAAEEEPPRPAWTPEPWTPRAELPPTLTEPRAPPAAARELWEEGPPAGDPVVLARGELRYVFRSRGAALELTALALGEREFPLRPGSGGWSLTFAQAGSAEEARVRDTDTEAHLAPVVALRPSEHALLLLWEGTTRVGTHVVGYRVVTRWEVAPSGLLEARIAVRFEAPEPVFLAEVAFPRLLVGPECGADRLLLPALGGYLLEQPFRAELDWTPFEQSFSRLAIPTLALYGATGGVGLLYTDDDYDEHWKAHNVGRSGDGLQLVTRHLPSDVFASRSFAPPYAVRLAAFTGDWVDVGAGHRRRLAEERPERTAPSPAATPPLYTYSFALRQGDDQLDLLPLLQARTVELLGPGAYVRLYSAHWPDRFEAFYDRGYLPGLPSFRAAVCETQTLGAIVAPYLQSSLARDPRLGSAPALSSLRATLLHVRDGEPLQPPVPGTVAPCAATRAWQELFHANAVDVAAFSGAHGLYFDYFSTRACLARDHAHQPGGGRYPWDARLAQLEAIRSALSTVQAPLLSTEAPHERLAHAVDLAHVFPRERLFRLDGLRSIPYFRTVHDELRLSRHPARHPENSESTPGLVAWGTAQEVLAFGQIPQVRPFRRGFGAADRYVARLVALLRDPTFQRCHAGQLLRPPEVLVADAQDLLERIGPRPGDGLCSTHADQPVIAGLHRSPEGKVLLSVTNPWIDEERVLRATVRLDTARTEGLGARVKWRPWPVTASSAWQDSAEGLTLDLELEPGALRCFELASN